MIEQEVVSSNLKKVKYEESTKKLEITFVNGALYVYAGVPKNVVDALLLAPSKGQYFNKNIRYSFKYTALKK